jgi:transposase
VRAQLIRVLTQAINLRAQLRQEGYRLESGSAETAVTRYARLDVPPASDDAVAPIRALLAQLRPGRRATERRARTGRERGSDRAALDVGAGVGPLAALSLQAAVDDIGRLRDASSASAFFGLVPTEDSSTERHHLWRITKAGPHGAPFTDLYCVYP